MKRSNLSARAGRGAVLAARLSLFAVFSASAEEDPSIPRLVSSSTIPANGDLNPYGIAFVPVGFPAGGPLAAGDVLVANFNASRALYAATVSPAPAGGQPEVVVSANGSPDTRSWIAEVNYLPWLNMKISAQYTFYNKFNGGGSTYDGLGRNASDNNAL
jgi:hypothetical protein